MKTSELSPDMIRSAAVQNSFGIAAFIFIGKPRAARKLARSVNGFANLCMGNIWEICPDVTFAEFERKRLAFYSKTR